MRRDQWNTTQSRTGSCRKVSWEGDVPDKRNTIILADFQALSFSFQKTAYQLQTTVRVEAGMQRTVKSVMDTSSGPNLVNSSVVPLNWQSYAKPFKALTLKTVNNKTVPVHGLTSLHVCMEDPNLCSCIGIKETFRMELLLGMSFWTGVSVSSSQTSGRLCPHNPARGNTNEVYAADFSSRPIFFAKITIGAYVSEAPNYIPYRRREEPNP